MNRYEVTEPPERNGRWVILDRHMWGYCSLPAAQPGDGRTPDLLPLEWRSREAAEAWLNRCYLAWQRGVVPAPRQWRPLPPGVQSPWVVSSGPPAIPGP